MLLSYLLESQEKLKAIVSAFAGITRAAVISLGSNTEFALLV